ncbi:MAG: hypothetical protein V4726_07815 [Verrucomicrobiota bacterium]
MKKIGAILSLVGLLSQSSALAWIGGPYSNNTYDGNTGGVFGGTIRGAGTSGIFKFAQDNQPYVSTFGDSIVYHKGMAYYGECYGQVDFNSSSISGITNGANNGTNGSDPNQSPFYRSVFGTGFGVQNGTDAGNATTNVFGNINAASANSYWSGKIESKKFAMRFSAKGEMSFFGNASEVTITIDAVSTGDLQEPRGNADTGLNSNPTAANARSAFPGTGSVVQTVTTENNYPNITDTVKIKVYGSRTSTGVQQPGNYAG